MLEDMSAVLCGGVWRVLTSCDVCEEDEAGGFKGRRLEGGRGGVRSPGGVRWSRSGQLMLGVRQECVCRREEEAAVEVEKEKEERGRFTPGPWRLTSAT